MASLTKKIAASNKAQRVSRRLDVINPAREERRRQQREQRAVERARKRQAQYELDKFAKRLNRKKL
jgi:hypothetical protein